MILLHEEKQDIYWIWRWFAVTYHGTDLQWLGLEECADLNDSHMCVGAELNKRSGAVATQLVFWSRKGCVCVYSCVSGSYL